MKRIKHNDLTHYFLRPHQELPRAYLRKCEKFFQTIQDRLITKKDASFLFRHQADKQKKVDKQSSSAYIGNYKKGYYENKRTRKRNQGKNNST